MMSAIRLLGSFPLRLLLPDFTRLCHTRSAGERGAHFSYGDDLRVERAPVVAGVDRGPDRLDLVDQHRTGRAPPIGMVARRARRSEEHTSELQSLMRTSYAVFCLKKKKIHKHTTPLTYFTLKQK